MYEKDTWAVVLFLLELNQVSIVNLCVGAVGVSSYICDAEAQDSDQANT
jgi:hypothetical protein